MTTLKLASFKVVIIVGPSITKFLLEGFNKRNYICFKTVIGRAGLFDTNIEENLLKNFLPNLIKGFHLRDIFNEDEKTLFFRALPHKTMIFKNLDVNSYKVCKERVSMLLCCNMDGSEKLKPIIIGQSENPTCFKNTTKAIYSASIEIIRKLG